MPQRLWQYQARVDALSPPAQTAAAPTGWGVVAPDCARRRALWQGQSCSDVLATTTVPPTTAPNGWDVIAPDRATKRKPADEGACLYALLTISQPAATGEAFDALAPDRPPRARARADVADPAWHYPPGPAPVAGNPTGWEATGPDRSRKLPTDRGLADYTLFKPTAPVAGNPVGWEALAPDRAARRRVDGGAQEYGLAKPPAAVAQNPLGWEVSQAPATRRPRAPAGGPVDVLGSATVPPTAPAWAWPTVTGDLARPRKTDAGHLDVTFRALAQPAAPNGWWVVLPDRAQVRRAPAFFQYQMNQPAPGAIKGPPWYLFFCTAVGQGVG